MKRIINLLLILAFLGLSGCWTKIYLSEQKEREQESILKDDVPPLLKAIKPTVISPGGTWGTVRSIINTNFSNINGTLDSIEHNIDVHDDSLTAHRIAINLRLLKSDTASMLQRYARQSALNTALAGKQNTLVSGTNIKTINNQSILGTGNIEITGGSGTMIYPSAGIPISTGSAWGTSITNNSTNWDTAYSERLRWDGGSTGLNAATARTSLALNNVTNESKATMFTNPQFTGTAVRWGTDTLATRAYARSSGGGGGLTATDVGNQIHDSIANGVQLEDVAVLIADTADMLAPYALLSEVGSGGVSEATVRQIVGDTIAERLRTAVPGLRLQDSSGYAPGNYMTRAGTTALVNTREAALGNPPADGYFVTSTAAGVRGWAAPSGGMVYPSGSGIPIVNNGAWGTTITNNSTNWNTAYGWGNHASAGYFVGTNATIRQLFSESVTGLTYTDSTGVLSLTSGYLIPTTTQASAWNDAATNFRSATQVATQIGDSLRAARNKDSDTGPLFIFGLGSGHISDTALFNNGRIAGAFYNSGSDTLYVTELRGVLVEGTGTETIAVQVSWDVNMKDETPTNLNTAALTVTSMTTGTSDTTFDNNGIPPGVWVWCTLSGASANNKPTMLSLTMTGYRRNRSN